MTIVLKYANKKTCIAFIITAFVTQDFGILANGVFVMVVSVAIDARFHPRPSPSHSHPLLADVDARDMALVTKNAKRAASNMAKSMPVVIEAKH
ncbi:hypothetical protein Nepgr_027610 [Nepenthes gracilis]|uniref:Uncharacterized protein n=1 Tax=Nepenthes gracilis TaxID=150966 RepID=A0AAD3Y1D0_NEPGR|nr:hypothetical protein Nepgr_027610 [Nepenthes gracilis]